MTLTLFEESKFDPMDIRTKSYENVSKLTVSDSTIEIVAHGQVYTEDSGDITELVLKR